MSKIIFYKSSNKSNNDYKKLELDETISENVTDTNKIISKNEILSEKKSYLQLLDKIKTSFANSNNISQDISNSILHIYDNYDEQLVCLHKLMHGTMFDEKKYFIQALKQKLDSYKQQDKKKTYDDYDDFITLENIIDKLVAYNMRCYYCNNKTLILFKNLRDDYQWTLDRINNFDEHSNANTIICCLKCNLQRRRKNSEKFKFTKQLEHKLLLLKKIE